MKSQLRLLIVFIHFSGFILFIEYFESKLNLNRTIKFSLTTSFDKMHRDNMFFEFR